MKFVMTVKKVGAPDTQAWKEEINTKTSRCLSHMDNGLEAQEYAEEVVKFFNNTLNPGQMPRELLHAEAVVQSSEMDEDEYWDRILELAEKHSEYVADKEAWLEDFGTMTPEESFYEEFPEHMSV